MSSQGGVGRREVAWRVFAAEYDGSSLEHSDSDEERAPNYVVTPTGARINRLFVVGVLTEIEQVGDEVLRARIVDPTGGFVVYAGQYQPEALAFLERAEAPMFVAVTGKARAFQPDDSELVYTSIRPESMNTVDAETRDRWTVQTAQQTLDRIRTFASALNSDQRGDTLRQALEAADVDDGLAAGVPLALDHYQTSTPYLAELQDVALDAARVVAGQQDEVGTLDASPDEPGDVSLDVDVSLETPAVETGTATETQTEPESEFDASASNSETEADSGFEGESESELHSDPETTETDESESTFESEPEPSAETESTAEPETESESETVLESEPEPEPVGESGVEEFDTSDTDAEPTDELGDFDSGPSDDGDDDLGDFDDQPMGEDVSGDMYEFDEGEREQIEEEFGTEFTTGAEVDAPGEADIETPEPAQEMTTESESEPDADTAAEPAEATGPDTGAAEPEQTEATEPEPTPAEADESGSESQSEPEPESESADESGEKPAPKNLENTVMEVMRDMNDGDGVEGERLMANVVNSYDVTPGDVEGALQDALMAGRCYESGEDTLKPI